MLIFAEQEAATSTTQLESPPARISSAEPGEWTIEDVVQYIANTDPALGQHADLFRKHVCFFAFSKNDNYYIFEKNNATLFQSSIH